MNRALLGIIPIVAVLAAGVVSCTSTTRDAELAELRKEVAELRTRVERAESALAEERARADEARASAERNSAQGLYEQAQLLEQQGKNSEAVKAYVRAARSGSGKAALRLGEIYNKGIPGVSVDYAMALKWYIAARALGEDVPTAKKP